MSQLHELEKRAMKIGSIVERFIKREYSLQWFKLKKEDEIRLIQLLVWADKYKVTVRFILKRLLPYWRQKYSKYRNARGLGVAIPTLVGRVSEEILQKKIKEALAETRHLARWRVKTQQKIWDSQWENVRAVEDWEHPARTIRKYSKRMANERKERQQWGQKMKRRPWRGNPWI